ncbi:hypothetical protein [Tunicatimonas pelagia]|uniref:hypothetical protein n=1 Tax=Tunicatimonas pelagia TaxID=931531 RepID=UPI00266577CA|nr:hypothetical protein [Tunicatimonas pelagia]WKN43758.1 hypothetical protein P0M28_02075 [Tunicatimonas pelagia]
MVEDVIMLVLCGTLAGAQHYHEGVAPRIACCGHYKYDMLKEFLALPNGLAKEISSTLAFSAKAIIFDKGG